MLRIMSNGVYNIYIYIFIHIYSDEEDIRSLSDISHSPRYRYHGENKAYTHNGRTCSGQ